MGIALALLAMVAFATNILITRYAVTRLAVEAGFFVVLAVNVAFAGVIYAVELAARAAPFGWNWRGAAWFVAGGIVGTFLARRLLFDTVRLIGPARASVFHSATPRIALPMPKPAMARTPNSIPLRSGACAGAAAALRPGACVSHRPVQTRPMSRSS